MSKGAIAALIVLGTAGGIFMKEKQRQADELEAVQKQLAAEAKAANKKSSSSTAGNIFSAVLGIIGGLSNTGNTSSTSKPDTSSSSSSSGNSTLGGILASIGSVFTGGNETLTLASYGSSGGSWGYRLKGDLMSAFGFTGYQAAGIVGNLDHESDGFRAMQEYNPLVSGSLGGYGIAQWTGPRRREFFAWAEARGLSVDSYAANWGFLHYELTQTWEKRAVAAVKATRSVEEATRVFSDTYLRPGIVHMSSRIEKAGLYV